MSNESIYYNKSSFDCFFHCSEIVFFLHFSVSHVLEEKNAVVQSVPHKVNQFDVVNESVCCRKLKSKQVPMMTMMKTCTRFTCNYVIAKDSIEFMCQFLFSSFMLFFPNFLL